MKTKLILTTIISALSASLATAQEAPTVKPLSPISKGHISIGTGIGIADFTAGKLSNGKSILGYDVSLSPSVGYFVTNHWLISAEILGSFSGATKVNFPNSQSAGIGLAARYYFGKPVTASGEVNRFRIYTEAGGSFERLWSMSLSNDVPVHSTANAGVVKVGLGVNYLLSDNIALEAGVTARRYFTRDQYSLNYNARLQMEIGVRVFLNRK